MNFTFKNGEKIIINVGSLILSASRFKVWTIYPSVSLDCVLDFLANSFEIIGGVPKEILIDNAATMMLKARTESNKGTVSPKFQQFADDYGFKVVPCIAGRPNTKSKVENPMRIIDEIMVYNGTLNNLEELHEKLEQITNEGKISIVDALYELTSKEIEVKNFNAMNAMVKVAGFPHHKELKDFDFDF